MTDAQQLQKRMALAVGWIINKPISDQCGRLCGRRPGSNAIEEVDRYGTSLDDTMREVDEWLLGAHRFIEVEGYMVKGSKDGEYDVTLREDTGLLLAADKYDGNGLTLAAALAEAFCQAKEGE